MVSSAVTPRLLLLGLAVFNSITFAASENTTITYNPTWEFLCVPAGQNSTATFRLQVDVEGTDAFTEYTISNNVMWGDQYAYGKTELLAVGETYELVYQFAFEPGRETVVMETNWVTPEDALVTNPMAIHTQTVEVSEKECILVETPSPTISAVPTSTPAPVGGSAAAMGIHQYSTFIMIIGFVFLF